MTITVAKSQTRVAAMYQMRQSGDSLQQIGSHFGISREGVRRRLVKHYGSTRVRGLLTTTEVARLARCTQRYMVRLACRGIIQPAAEVGRGRKLWEPATIAIIIMYIDSHRCLVCNEPLSSSRWVYCSEACWIKACREVKEKSNKAKNVASGRRNYSGIAHFLLGS